MNSVKGFRPADRLASAYSYCSKNNMPDKCKEQLPRFCEMWQQLGKKSGHYLMLAGGLTRRSHGKKANDNLSPQVVLPIQKATDQGATHVGSI